jgi:hypothetical protein
LEGGIRFWRKKKKKKKGCVPGEREGKEVRVGRRRERSAAGAD